MYLHIYLYFLSDKRIAKYHGTCTCTCTTADSYVIFADLVKAYDTVDRELLWTIMSRYGCPEELIFVLRKLYTDITIELNHIKKNNCWQP